eukprot:8644932-Alexandrium_andersonii.AAC.1
MTQLDPPTEYARDDPTRPGPVVGSAALVELLRLLCHAAREAGPPPALDLQALQNDCPNSTLRSDTFEALVSPRSQSHFAATDRNRNSILGCPADG